MSTPPSGGVSRTERSGGWARGIWRRPKKRARRFRWNWRPLALSPNAGEGRLERPPSGEKTAGFGSDRQTVGPASSKRIALSAMPPAVTGRRLASSRSLAPRCAGPHGKQKQSAWRPTTCWGRRCRAPARAAFYPATQDTTLRGGEQCREEHWRSRPAAFFLPQDAERQSLLESAPDIAIQWRSGAFRLSLGVPERGLEPPRPITATWPSTMRVYQFRHSGIQNAGYGIGSRASCSSVRAPQFVPRAVTPAGFEPATHGLKVRCSARLSYEVVFSKRHFCVCPAAASVRTGGRETFVRSRGEAVSLEDVLRSVGTAPTRQA